MNNNNSNHSAFPNSMLKNAIESQEFECFSIAFLVHTILLLLMSVVFYTHKDEVKEIVICSSMIEEEPLYEESIEIIDQLEFDEEETALTEDQTLISDSDFSSSLKVNELDIPSNPSVELFDVGTQISAKSLTETLSGVNKELGAGISVESSTGGALDRLTVEISANAESKDLTVVWLLDASISLNQQRQHIHSRFDKILEELRLAGHKNSIKHSICCFGSSINFITEVPNDDLHSLKKDISSIKLDETGVENTFSAVGQACKKYAKFGSRVMIIIFTDEVGDDIGLLDEVSRFASSKGCVVYAVGSPSPFGKTKTQFKFVDFDPKYDDNEVWVEIQQGPETLRDMILDLRTLPIDDETLDSGFGPFALSKLCLDTGGLFFSVHPNRTNNKVDKKEVAPLYSYISRFFDHDVMIRYRPDYRSVALQEKENQSHVTKKALLHACSIPLHISGKQTLRFKAFSEGLFVSELGEAQKFSAQLEPKINEIYNALIVGEPMHKSLEDRRWIASYCLAMGRILATKCRIESYNLILAEAKSGLKKKNDKSNVWTLSPSEDLSTSNSAIKKYYEKSRSYLKYVVENFPNTPWSLIANEELNTPISYSWVDDYEEPPKPREGNGGNNIPKDDMIKPKLVPKIKRKIDKI